MTAHGAADRPPDRKPLTVVFLGSPEFALPVLEALTFSRHRVIGVITQPDRPSGRGLRARPTPVRLAARRLGLPVETIPAGDRDVLATRLEELRPDIVVTAAWAGLLNRASLAAARVAALNVHPSMLPRYRGAAPVERALMAGEPHHGVTVMHLAKDLDAGDIVLQREVRLEPEADAGQARLALAQAGAQLLVTALDLLATGEAPRVRQDDAAATWAPKLSPADERITWEMAATEIANRVRALSPFPGAYFELGGQRVKVLTARAGEPGGAGAGSRARPGTVCGRRGPDLLVATGGGGIVTVGRVKPAGGREISGADFANGRRLQPGDVIADGGS